MRKKKPARRPEPKRKELSAATRAADERLRESLRNADLKAFDNLLPKAIRQIGTKAPTHTSSAKRARLKAAGHHVSTVHGFLSMTDAEAAEVEKRVRAAKVRAKAKKS